MKKLIFLLLLIPFVAFAADYDDDKKGNELSTAGAIDVDDLVLISDPTDVDIIVRKAITDILEAGVGSVVQDWNATLDTLAAITYSANMQSFFAAANYAAMQTLLSIPQQADCSGITAGMCLDTDNGALYVWDGDSVEQIASSGSVVAVVATGDADPTVNDDTNGSPTAATPDTSGYSVGDIWINNTASPPEIWTCTDNTNGAAVWKLHYIFTASATPNIEFTDTTHNAGGKISVNSIDVNNAEMLLGVDDSSGDNQTYLDLDGVNKDVKVKKPFVPEQGNTVVYMTLTGGSPEDSPTIASKYYRKSAGDSTADSVVVLPAIGIVQGNDVRMFYFVNNYDEADTGSYDLDIDPYDGADVIYLDGESCLGGKKVELEEQGEWAIIVGGGTAAYWTVFAHSGAECEP